MDGIGVGATGRCCVVCRFPRIFLMNRLSHATDRVSAEQPSGMPEAGDAQSRTEVIRAGDEHGCCSVLGPGLGLEGLDRSIGKATDSRKR